MQSKISFLSRKDIQKIPVGLSFKLHQGSSRRFINVWSCDSHPHTPSDHVYPWVTPPAMLQWHVSSLSVECLHPCTQMLAKTLSTWLFYSALIVVWLLIEQLPGCSFLVKAWCHTELFISTPVQYFSDRLQVVVSLIKSSNMKNDILKIGVGSSPWWLWQAHVTSSVTSNYCPLYTKNLRSLQNPQHFLFQNCWICWKSGLNCNYPTLLAFLNEHTLDVEMPDRMPPYL